VSPPPFSPWLVFLAAAAVSLTAVFGFIEKARKLARDCYRYLFRLLVPKENPHRVDLKITPDRTGACRWQEGSRGDERVMHVNCKLYLTNVGPQPAFQILEVYVKKPRTQGFPLPNMRQRMNPRLPEAPPDARLALPFEATFLVNPPMVKSGEVFKADIVLVDQFGEKHTVKKVEFAPWGGPGWANLAQIGIIPPAPQDPK
jgi:hypothetical protein